MSISKFPLPKLPISTQKCIVGNWDPPELIEYSFISKKCKNLVKSLHVKEGDVLISIEDTICIAINSLFFYFYNDWYRKRGNDEVRRQLKAPRSVELNWNSQKYNWNRQEYILEKNDFDMKEWLEHLEYIFNCPKVRQIDLVHCSQRFDPDRIKEVFQNCTELRIFERNSFDFSRRVLENFLPVRKLSVSSELFEDSKIPNQLLIQNFDILTLDFKSRSTVSLNQLLITNSKSITLYGVGNIAKLLNKFIKMWIKGSNTQMECLTVFDIFENGEFDFDDVLKKIEHVKIPEDHRRRFKGSVNVVVDGGIDILRYDGLKATILFIGHNVLYIYVWHDHCIAD
ncbi:unnamed protein product [Caenorhabditis brenneri]